MNKKQQILSSIPSVDELLKLDEIQILCTRYSRNIVLNCVREYLNEYRRLVLSLKEEDLKQVEYKQETLLDGIAVKLHKTMSNKLVNVINATGVVLHTNLGRAVLSEKAKESLWRIACRYSNLEFELETGKRGSRYSHVEDIICRLTGAEAAMVVNNNAAAVMLVLGTMAKDKEVIVSRGQLVEIGGSFRVPDVMVQSGAVLKEVGATNKTHLWDYEAAATENTAALMKVHTSNYRILGFTKEVESEELVELGKKLNIPVIEDLGSGVLLDLQKYGLPYEPTVQSAVKAGMDVVTFSGDKMLGGPQAGIIVGQRQYIEKMRKNPLTRAFRIDKLTLAALETTLKLYLDEETAMKEIPVLRMLTISKEELHKKAKRLYGKLLKRVGDKCSIAVIDEFSEVGGGSMPMHKMPTKAVSVTVPNLSIDKLEEALRDYTTPVVGRINKDRFIIDVRTVFEEEIDIIVEALAWSLKGEHSISALESGDML
ncbi:MAG: L-seryl-tRNA(Sec) selenium transferase [Clostridia bacterium]|jgi:L-seryl-tRNA(Ser) seleniumtransferase|nr:L-seryl-tRNA(Sec) selenium transferase [Clostridia bacterium]